ncbi:MAG: hypothetical protein VW127_08240 [Flavobacteriaceae bacterium]
MLVSAQKIKLKKNDILIDRVSAGRLIKSSVIEDLVIRPSYIIEDQSNQKRYHFRQEFCYSPLYTKDKRYFYYTLEELNSKEKKCLNLPGFYLSKRRIIKSIPQLFLIKDRQLESIKKTPTYNPAFLQK